MKGILEALNCWIEMFISENTLVNQWRCPLVVCKKLQRNEDSERKRKREENVYEYNIEDEKED